MKKMVVLAAVTCLLVLIGAFGSPQVVMSCIPAVKIATPAQVSYAELVSANGTLAEKYKQELSLSAPLVAKEVAVEVGDRVEIGDLIAVIDKKETIAVIQAAAASTAIPAGLPFGIAELIAGVTASSSTLTEDMLPEKLVSTFSGVVTGVGIAKGVATAPDAALITVSDLDRLVANISVPEQDIGKIAEGQVVTLSGTALEGRGMTGHVGKIAPSARKQLSGVTNETVFDVQIDIDPTNVSIRPGMSVKADVQIGETQTLMTVPYECVDQDDQGREFVYIYQNGRAVRRYIETGLETAEGVQVTAGLTAGDHMITGAAGIKENRIYRLAN